MQQIKVSRYQRAACWRFVQTDAECLHLIAQMVQRNAKINTPHFRFTLFSESSRAQTSSEAGFTDLSRMQQQKIDWRSCSEPPGSAAASEQRLWDSPFNLWLPGKVAFYYTSAKTFPSNFINNVATNEFGLKNPQIQFQERSRMSEQWKQRSCCISTGSRSSAANVDAEWPFLDDSFGSNDGICLILLPF